MTRPDEIAALADEFDALVKIECWNADVFDRVSKALRLSATSPGHAVREAWQTARKYVSSHADAAGAAAAIIAMEAALAPAKKACKDHPSRRCLPEECCLTAPAEKAGDELVLQWRDGAPPKPWCDEWFIAETTFRDRVVLTALPEEYSYDFKTADDTYIKADKIKRWMQFPDSQFIAPATPTPPSADVARLLKIAFVEKTMHHPVGQYTDRLDHVFESMADSVIQSAAPGGGTKSDGACLSSLPSGESEPLVTTASAPSDTVEYPAQEPEAVAWRSVVGFEERYEVSSEGDIRNKKTGKIQAKKLMGSGYVKADLWNGPIHRQTSVHRVVAEAFIAKPLGKNEVNHINGDKADNRVGNLQWCNRAENTNHSRYVLGNDIKPILAKDIETGEEEYYPSIEAAGRLGYNATCISEVLAGRVRTHAGKTWERTEWRGPDASYTEPRP